MFLNGDSSREQHIQFRGINSRCWFCTNNPPTLCIFPAAAIIRDLLAGMNQRADENEDLLGRISPETRRSLSFSRPIPFRASRLYYYIILTRTAKGTKLDLPTKLDPRRLSPFFPRTRRVSEPMSVVVVLSIRLARALIVQIKSILCYIC